MGVVQGEAECDSVRNSSVDASNVHVHVGEIGEVLEPRAYNTCYKHIRDIPHHANNL